MPYRPPIPSPVEVDRVAPPPLERRVEASELVLDGGAALGEHSWPSSSSIARSRRMTWMEVAP